MENLTGEKLLLFALAALPGFIAIRFYSLRYPREGKDWKDSLTEAVTYSIINLIVWIGLFPRVVREFSAAIFAKEAEPKDEALKAFNVVLDHGGSVFFYAIVSPILLVIVLNFLRRTVFPRWLNFDNPVRTAWDWIFTESLRTPLYVCFVLKSKGEGGKPVYKVGYYNGTSYVATYPCEPEIYVERLHKINPDGTIGEPIPGSKGMFIRYSECERLEFLADKGYRPAPPLLLRLANGLDHISGFFEELQEGVSQWLERGRINRRAGRRNTAGRGRT